MLGVKCPPLYLSAFDRLVRIRDIYMYRRDTAQMYSFSQRLNVHTLCRTGYLQVNYCSDGFTVGPLGAFLDGRGPTTHTPGTSSHPEATVRGHCGGTLDVGTKC